MEPIVNRVAQSGIEVFDLSGFLPSEPVQELDIAPFLVERMILREKVFREAVASHDFSAYEGRIVAITCSVDTIIPAWAWMLVASRLHGIAQAISFGSAETALREHFTRSISAFDWSRYDGGIVVVKGCGSAGVPESAYVEVMTALQGVARKVMFGEPCSSVPLWRRPAG